jgi:iron(III) transport system substrate-binding protein
MLARSSSRLALLLLGTTVLVGLAGGVALADAGKVNVYTYREPQLIKPLFDAFTADTGIAVEVIFAKEGLEQKIQSEGANSPADVLLTVDIARLLQAVDLGITQPVQSEVLNSSIPEGLRDPQGNWFGTSMRARVVYASKDRVGQDSIAYENLADPKWKGRICIRSGQHIYNNALFAAVVAKYGEEKAEAWIKGLRDNLAKKPSGGDRDVAKDIAAGVCDIGLGNTYYVGLMLNREKDKKPWAEAIKVLMPKFEGGGTHVNISGVTLARHAPNKENAIKLMEWLAGDRAQGMYASMNYEYPVKAGIPADPTVVSFGELKIDPLPLSEIARFKKKAAEIVDKVAFDEGPGA